MGEARAKSQGASRKSGAGRGSARVVFGLVVSLIVIALVVAVAFGGSDNEAADDSTRVRGQVTSVGEALPVEVGGEILPPLDDSGSDSAVGMTAPALDGSSFDGSAVSITPGDGRDYMVVFLAHWCPHCNAEVPRLIEWQNSGAVPAGLEVVGVSTASTSERPNFPPSQWVVDMGWPWPVMADSAVGDAAEAYGVSAFPFFVIVGGDGTVKLRSSGEKEIDELSAMVADALSR